MRTKKETLKSVKAEFEKFKEDARNALRSYRFPSTRALLTVEAADAQGRLNGMTEASFYAVKAVRNYKENQA